MLLLDEHHSPAPNVCNFPRDLGPYPVCLKRLFPEAASYSTLVGTPARQDRHSAPHKAFNTSSCNGLRLSPASSSFSQFDSTPSLYHQLYSQPHASSAAHTGLRSISVYSGVVTVNLSVSVASDPQAKCANLSLTAWCRSTKHS